MSREAQKQNTRDNILDAAESLFAAQGFSATTINHVARDVGIQGPAIYKHFANKRALYEEVLERLFTPFIDTLEECEQESDRQARIIRQHLKNILHPSRSVQRPGTKSQKDLHSGAGLR